MSDTLAETGVDDWWMYPENIEMVLDWLAGEDVQAIDVIQFVRKPWEFSDWYQSACMYVRAIEINMILKGIE